MFSEVTLYSAHPIFTIMYSDSAAIDCDDHEDYMISRFCLKLVILGGHFSFILNYITTER